MREWRCSILMYEDKYVGGFSFKTQKVWFTRRIELAKKFTLVDANRFITDHIDTERFMPEGITILIRKPGQKEFLIPV